jgi:hypothetical protein
MNKVLQNLRPLCMYFVGAICNLALLSQNILVDFSIPGLYNPIEFRPSLVPLVNLTT